MKSWLLVLRQAFNGVFLVRTFVSLLLGALTVWGLSFWVSNWVVQSSQQGMIAALQQMQQQQSLQGQDIKAGEIAVRTDLATAITESSKRLETAITNLSSKMDALNVTISGTSEKVVALTVTVDALNGRLNDSIARQANFEKVVLAQLLKASPASVESEKQAMDFWLKQGLTTDLYKEVAFTDAGNAVASWAKFKNIMPQ